ncbi:MAG: hypothetical protein J7J17_02435 [Hadesarchaea archaeon]|nr:hypothetical protein [Hadesarchaea archaeon]
MGVIFILLVVTLIVAGAGQLLMQFQLLDYDSFVDISYFFFEEEGLEDREVPQVSER